jgi:hypothetical protein
MAVILYGSFVLLFQVKVERRICAWRMKQKILQIPNKLKMHFYIQTCNKG